MPDPVPLPFTQLITPISADAAEETLLDVFSGLGFAVTSWQSGGVGLTMVKYLAQMTATISSTIAQIGKSGFLYYATGSWLTLRAQSSYDETRQSATTTVGIMRLTSSTGAAPYTLQVGQVWVSTPAGLRYRNTTGGSIASGPAETLDIEFTAEYPGASYNIPVGSSLTLVTSLPGLTVTNPVYSGGDWITTDGSDEQSDASLAAQCIAKWATRSFQAPADVYTYWAQEASDAVARVLVNAENPDGPGTLRVYIAGASGGISSSAVITAVDDVLQIKRSICSSLTTLGTSEQAVVITGPVYYTGVSLAACQAGVEAAIAELFSSIPIGGVVIGTDPGKVFTDSIIAAVRSVTGVVRFDMSAPSSDVTVSETSVAVPNIVGITYVAT